MMKQTLRSRLTRLAQSLGLRVGDHGADQLLRSIMAEPGDAGTLLTSAKAYREQLAKESQDAAQFATVSRNTLRRNNFELAMAQVNEVGGGEPRNIRRSMARARAKRGWSGVVAA